MKNRNIGIALSYLNTGLNMVCGLFLSSFLLRILGETEYGIYQTIASFANYLVLLEFGTGTVMTRNIAMCRGRQGDRTEVQRNVTTIWMVALILAGVILVVAEVFYCNIGRIYAATLDAGQIRHAREIFAFVTVYLLGSFLMQTLNGVILAHDHYWFASVQNLCRTVLRTALLVGLLWLNRSALVIVLVDAALSLGLLAISGLFVIRRLRLGLGFGRMDPVIVRTAAPLCSALFLQTIVNQANNNVDKFLIGIMLSPESVSLYSVAMYVFSIFSSLTTIPISMFAPEVVKAVQRDASPGGWLQSLVPSCRMTAIIGGLIYFGFIAMGKPFVALVYGEQYMLAWVIAIIVMTPMYLNMVTGVLINVLDALNKRMIRSVTLSITTAANIALTVVWLDMWGEVGAALATALCTFIGQVLLMNLYYGKKLKIDVVYLYRQAMGGILLWFVLGCAAALLAGRLIENPVWELAVCFVLFASIAGGGYLFCGIRPQEKAALKILLRRR